MKVTLSLPDEVYERYIAHGESVRPKRTPEAIMGAALTHYSTLCPSSRHLVIPFTDLRRLEDAVQHWNIRSVEELCTQVERLARLKIGDVAIEFSPMQLAEIRRRAEGRGKTLQDELTATAQQLGQMLFNTLG